MKLVVSSCSLSWHNFIPSDCPLNIFTALHFIRGTFFSVSARYGVDNFTLPLEKQAATPQSAVLGRNALHTKLLACSWAFDLMGPLGGGGLALSGAQLPLPASLHAFLGPSILQVKSDKVSRGNC